MPEELVGPNNSELSKHWQHFKKGLLLFVISALLILAGYKWQPLIQVPGLMLLVPALFYAARGYLGILRFRLKNSFSINKK